MSKLFPNIQITRSKSHKIARQDSFGNWISDESFVSVKGECLIADMQEASDELMDFCRTQVDGDFAEIRSRLESQGLAVVEGDAPVPREPYEMPRREPEPNPFVVSAAPSAATVNGEPYGNKAIYPIQTGADLKHPQMGESVEEPEQVEPAAPARRGRKPKVEGPAAMEALKASVPPETPLATYDPALGAKPVFQATADDLPDNIAAAPHEPAPPKSQNERLDAIVAELYGEHQATLEARAKAEGKTARGLAAVALTLFMRSFFRVLDSERKEVPKAPDPLYETHLPLFEAFGRHYGAQILSKPQDSGEAAGGAWAVFVRKIDAWPDGFKVLAKSMAAYHYPDAVTDLLEFMETDGLTKPDQDMMVFLQLLRIGRNSLLAARDAATKRGCSISQVVGKLNLDLASEKDVLSAVAGA